MSRQDQIRDLWRDIQDIIGTSSLWPEHIRRLFWTRDISNVQRLLICAFCYVNGLNPQVFLQWATLLHLFRDNGARNHAIYLFAAFHQNRYRYLYGYNITNNRYEYLDGSVRVYIHKTHRK